MDTGATLSAFWPGCEILQSQTKLTENLPKLKSHLASKSFQENGDTWE